MNIAVLGKSRINSMLKKQFELEGITPLLFEDLEGIRSISGEIGAFVIKSRDGSFEASNIFVTEEPSINHDNITGQKGAISLDDDIDPDTLPFGNPLVFILDYPVDSLNYMTRTALEKAIGLAKRKRKVVFLAKYMRTAGDLLENLYKEARNLGVDFFKYESITVDYSSAERVFRITASDIYDSLKISTHTPVFAGGTVYSDAFLKVIKLLRLKLDSKNHVNEDNFFLFPSLTSRKGVYFTSLKNTSGSSSEIMLKIQYILSDIRDGIRTASASGTMGMGETLTGAKNLEEYAKIDNEKCAFCYTCYRVCPHSAMVPDYENSVMKNLRASCYGCGICYPACPANAITMDRKNEVAKSPTSGSLKVFCCENSGEIAYQSIAESLNNDGVRVEITPSACGGELSVDAITKALKDFDRVLVAVCLDDACRHFEGNKRVKRYVERAKSMLKSSGMDENRIVYLQLSHAMQMVLDGYIREMVQA
jgi:Fe-S-cluster-containing hydrogenase component 2